MFVSKKYVVTLESTIAELKSRVMALEQENRQLYGRLLERHNVMPIKGTEPSLETLDQRSIEGLLRTAPIFGPDEFDADAEELTDNRKGNDDAFVS